MPKLTLELTWPQPPVELDLDRRPHVEMDPHDPSNSLKACGTIFLPLKTLAICTQVIELDFDTKAELDAFVAKLNVDLEEMANNDTPAEHRSRWLFEELLRQEKERG